MKKNYVPLYSLQGFKRVKLAPGASATVDFTITPEIMAVVTEDGRCVIESGSFKVYVGGAAPHRRSQELGMPGPAEGSFTVR